jgi:N,N'-diacetyllegionaminate synthase
MKVKCELEIDLNKNNFDSWNIVKQNIDNKKREIHFKQGEIYFINIGQNIGYEIYGKQEQFLRPVIIFRKINKYTFLAIPLTSKIKDDKYHQTIKFKDRVNSAILTQIRTFDSKRLVYKIGKIDKKTFDNLERKFSEFYRLTPKRGGYTLQKEEQRTNECIISQIDTNVKESVFIIAEAGVNHNGSIELAKKLIDVASQAGADAVKFQTFKAKNLVSKDTKKAQYQQDNIQDNDNSQYNMLKKLELDIDTHKELIFYCKEKNIMFLSTPFDHDSIDMLDNLGLEIFKIPSGEITNLPYLRHIGSLQKKVILSTGMADIGEIEDALNILVKAGTKKEDITILHANTMYPTPMKDVNLKAMITIGKTFDVTFGYSDHTLGIEVDIAAVAMGASCIEKHFTLDKTMQGPDHKASLEPDELKAMVSAIRNIEIALGSSIKKPSLSETPNIKVVRKSIVAKKNIQKGEIFSEKNLTIKRPANGISPMLWDDLIGRIASKDYKEDELI